MRIKITCWIFFVRIANVISEYRKFDTRVYLTKNLLCNFAARYLVKCFVISAQTAHKNKSNSSYYITPNRENLQIRHIFYDICRNEYRLPSVDKLYGRQYSRNGVGDLECPNWTFF